MESTGGFIELRVISCKSLKAFNFFQKLSVCALVYIAGDDDKKTDRKQLKRTPTDREGDGNPEWNHTVRFEVSDDLLRDCDKIFVHFDLRHEGSMFGDKTIGEVVVPLLDLIQESNNGVVRFVTYQVRTTDGKANGELNFSFKVVNIGKDEGSKVETPASLITGYPLCYHHSPAPEPSLEVESESPEVHYPVLDLEDMLVQGPHQLHSTSSGSQDLNLIQETNYFLPQNGYYELPPPPQPPPPHPPPPPPLPYPPPPPAATAYGGPYYYRHPPPPPGSNIWGLTPYVFGPGYCAPDGTQLGSADVPLETWPNGWQE
ncbi:hypothetical protein ES288_A02G169600v1 [Gossypium darwinii]|uniref:C2 domain-containing protein n=1 Tax=Gossypium darwinii TaxID=34276 RepID=A0A5D2HEW4_GOSDA|nr:hypothetical protein ES288_A02G169600v1 [Gossypium darwinii]